MKWAIVDLAAMVVVMLIVLNSSSAKEEKRLQIEVTDQVYFDIEIGGEKQSRIVIGLFGGIVPKTVDNFKSIAEGKVDEGGELLTYKGVKFYRVVKDFLIQAGDFYRRDESGPWSIYGHTFADENFKLKHWGAGWVSMANRGPDTNQSPFLITLRAAPQRDEMNVVFGKVLEGMAVVRKIEDLKTDKNKKPLVDVEIVDCGSLPVDEPFLVDGAPIAGLNIVLLILSVIFTLP